MNIDDETNLPADDEPEAGQAGDEGDDEAEVSGPDDENDDPDNGAEGEDPDGQPEDEDDDYEVEGKQYRIPKSLKEHITKGTMLHKDYTQKTQELADGRKQVKALAEKVQTDFKVKMSIIEDLAEVKGLEKQIALYKGLNWDAIQAKDMGEYLRLQRQFETARMTLEEKSNAVAQKQHEQSLQEQREAAEHLQEGLRVLKGKFPDWTPQTFVDLGHFGVSLGFSEEEVAAIADPRYMEVLHFAKIGKQFVESQKNRKPSKPANEQQPAAKPVPKVKSARPAPGQLNDQMSDAEWFKRRNEQLRRRA